MLNDASYPQHEVDVISSRSWTAKKDVFVIEPDDAYLMQHDNWDPVYKGITLGSRFDPGPECKNSDLIVWIF